MSTSRRSFVLAAPLLLVGALNPGLAQAAPTRTPLPTDGNIAVYVGVKATWQSLSKPAVATNTVEMGTDVSVYDLNQMPTRDNLDDHSLTLMPLPASSDWYVFKPTTDTFDLTFDIADTANRLSKIVVSDLITGEVLGSVAATQNGAAIKGKLTLSWLQPYYRIDGYDTANNRLFLLAASNGRPDTYSYFPVAGSFQPYRPATMSSMRFAGGDGVFGPEGDPYNKDGVLVSASAGQWFSRGCGAKDEINNAPITNPMQPPAPLLDYIKKRRIETVNPSGYPSNDKADQLNLANAIIAAGQEDQTRALSELTQLPYSDNTGHWHAKFTGSVTAFFMVPYTVSKHNTLFDLIKQVFTGVLASMLTNARDKLATALTGAFAGWLVSDAGKQSGLNAGMVIPLGDVKVTGTAEDAKSMPVALSLLQEVTFKLTPDIAPPTGLNGGGSVVSTGAWTTPAPPGPSNGGDLSFDVNGIAKKQLAKGFKWKASGCISSTRGYHTGTSEEFQTPIDASVTVPCTLTVLLHLKIVANASCTVMVKKESEPPVQGSTTSMNGQNVFDMFQVTPATYTVEGTASPIGGSRVPRKATQTVIVNPGVEQVVSLTF